MPAYVYRVTKYDPADSDEHGHYTGAEDTRSDHGEVEASYLQAVAAFAAETGVDHLVIREPQVSSFVHFGLEPVVDGFGLKGLFPPARHGSSEPIVPPGFHDGAQVPLNTGLELVRAMLRDNGGTFVRLPGRPSSVTCSCRRRGDTATPPRRAQRHSAGSPAHFPAKQWHSPPRPPTSARCASRRSWGSPR